MRRGRHRRLPAKCAAGTRARAAAPSARTGRSAHARVLRRRRRAIRRERTPSTPSSPASRHPRRPPRPAAARGAAQRKLAARRRSSAPSWGGARARASGGARGASARLSATRVDSHASAVSPGVEVASRRPAIGDSVDGDAHAEPSRALSRRRAATSSTRARADTRSIKWISLDVCASAKRAPTRRPIAPTARVRSRPTRRARAAAAPRALGPRDARALRQAVARFSAAPRQLALSRSAAAARRRRGRRRRSMPRPMPRLVPDRVHAERRRAEAHVIARRRRRR